MAPRCECSSKMCKCDRALRIVGIVHVVWMSRRLDAHVILDVHVSLERACQFPAENANK